MKKLIYILLLFSFYAVSGQHVVKHGTSFVKINASDIPSKSMYDEEPPFDGPTKVTVWSQDFEESAIEDPYTVAHMEEDFPWYTFISPSRTSYVSTNYHSSIVSKDNSRVMRNHYPAGNWGVGSESGNDGEGDGTGVNIFSNLLASGGWDELYLKYSIKFSDGFDWGLGGKLPGFSIQPTYTDGGSTSGSTILMMWQPDGAVKIYAFYDTYTFYGPVHDFVFTDDTWYSVCLRLVNSSTDADDGIIEVFFDGIKDDQSITNASLREQSDKHINVLRLNTFQGGGDDSYAPDNDGDVWIDDMEIFYLTGEATTEHPIGRTVSPADRDISYYITGQHPNPTPSDFEGTIFKEVTFAELAPDQTTDARARIFLGSDDIERWEVDSAYSDSTVIRINDQGTTDTVWQVKLVMPKYDGATGQGTTWIGEMELNGVDNTDDTLTQYNFTYYIKLGLDWDWDESKGGKLPGIMGMDADGDYGPGGNVFECGCVPYNSYEYCWDDGFTARGGFDWYGDDIGFYAYTRNNSASLSCDNPTYGSSWNTARKAGDEAQGLDWELDKWYKITQRVYIGTAGSANGYLQMARNDTIMFSYTGIKLIDDSRIKADAWYLAAFSGGSPSTLYKGMHAWFDDLILWQEEKRDAYSVGDVMTNVPDAKTPNTD